MLNHNPKIIFMGTPEFAVPTLTAIHQKYGLSAVVTIPDKPTGRGQKITSSAVKLKALELGINVIQPEFLKSEDFINQIKEINPDIIVVVAFKILPKEIYTLPKIASFNIHGSLLPKYRGAAPINHCILNGDKISGVTSFILQEKVDTGNIILKKQTELPINCTAGELHDLLMPLSASCALETIEVLLKGDFKAEKQDDTLATPAPKIFKENCKINFNLDNTQVKNFIHSISPSPGGFAFFNGKNLKILKAEIVNTELKSVNYSINSTDFIVGCGNKSIKLLEIQPEGKKATMVADFIRGYRGEKNGTFE